MNIAYLVLPLLEAILGFALLLLVALKVPRRRPVRIQFLAFIGCLTLWGLFVFFMRSSPNAAGALFWERWLIPLSFLISVTFFHFTARYTEHQNRSWLIPGLYLVVLTSVPFFVSTNLFLTGMQLMSYGYAPELTPAITFPIIFSVSLVLISLRLLMKAFRRSLDPIVRTRISLIMLGASISLIGMAFDLLPILGLPLYPGFVIGNIIFCILTSIAILKHKLFNINMILRKGATYFLTTISFLIMILVLWTVIIINTNHFPDWVFFVIVAGLTLTLPMIWWFFQKQVDKWFYYERYAYLKALEIFSQETQSLVDPALGNQVIKLLSHALRATHVHVFLPSGQDQDLTARFSTEPNLPFSRFTAQSPLVHWFSRKGTLLTLRDIELMPQFISTDKEIVRGLESEIVVPVRTRDGQLSGLLLLGKKVSLLPYSSEDKELLQAFATQMATKLENIRLYSNALNMRGELENLSRRLVEIQEQERREIARELHDEISQSLAMTKILLDTAVSSPQKTAASLNQAQTVLKEVIGQVREMSLKLRPSILDDLGLLPTLEWHLKRYTSRTGIKVQFDHKGLETQMPGNISTAVFRIVQEGLANIAKHSRADKARLSLSKKGDCLHIELRDQGKGFDPAKIQPTSTGLMGIRERITMFGGKMHIYSSPGQGTRLMIDIPLIERRDLIGDKSCTG